MQKERKIEFELFIQLPFGNMFLQYIGLIFTKNAFKRNFIFYY